MRVSAIALGGLVLLVLWQVLSWLVDRASLSRSLPPPAEVLSVLWTEFPGSLSRDLFMSAYRVLAGLILAAIFAAPIGLAMGQVPTARRLLAPLVYLLYPLPKIVLLPILFVFLGIGDAPKVMLISLVAFFQILVIVRDASSGIRPELVTSVRSLGARRGQLFRYAYWPATLPALLTGARVSVGTGIAVLFVAEQFGTGGLAYYIFTEWGLGNYRQMYAGVLVTGLFGFGLYALLEWLEHKLCPWLYTDKQPT